MTGNVCPDPLSQPLRFLLEGPPKVGKTVAMRRLVELLREHGAVVSGFVTDEIRERDRRVGFVVCDVAGPEAVLAHQDFQTGVQVSRFGVDVPAFERVALPALRRAQETGGAVIIDELGRMELASAPFVEAMDTCSLVPCQSWPRCMCTSTPLPMPSSDAQIYSASRSPRPTAMSCLLSCFGSSQVLQGGPAEVGGQGQAVLVHGAGHVEFWIFSVHRVSKAAKAAHD